MIKLNMNSDMLKTSQELIETELHSLLLDSVEDRIEQLEDILHNCEQLEIPVTHGYKEGMYTREILIKKDTVLVGKVHKHDYIDIMLSGDITVVTTTGVKRYTGYNILDGSAGRKRAGYAHEDTRWLTIHNVDEIDAGENYVPNMTFNTVQEYLVDIDQISYKEALVQLGYTEDQVQAEMTETTVFRLPEEFSSSIKLAVSDIHGRGVFTAREFQIGELVGPAKILDRKTILGRYTNHSKNPNSVMQLLDDSSVALVATRALLLGEEITIDYLATRQMNKETVCQQ